MGTTQRQSPVVLGYGSSSRPGYRGDPFEFLNGHYVGHDGFIVPRDFTEFHERFPQYIRRWVTRHAARFSAKEDIEDWSQDLAVHMSSLPPTSKHRKAGKQDVVQTFDPFLHYGANQPRFQNYINLCLANRLRTIRSLWNKEPMSRAQRLMPSEEVKTRPQIDERVCRLLSERLTVSSIRTQKQIEDRLFLAEFLDLARTQDPTLLPALQAIAETNTLREAARQTEIENADVGRLHYRLHKLGRSFLNGAAGRRQRTEPPEKSKLHAPATDAIQPAHTHTVWNRVELYGEVWDRPLVKLAREYGISDVRIGKVCRRLKIPLPGRGYWAKRTVGCAADPLPLQDFNDAPIIRRLKFPSRRRRRKIPEFTT